MIIVSLYLGAVLVLHVLWRAWVLQVLWNWFIPEHFHSVSHLSFPFATGLVLMLMWATTIPKYTTASWTFTYYSRRGKRTFNFDGGPFIDGAAVLLIGGVVHQILLR